MAALAIQAIEAYNETMYRPDPRSLAYPLIESHAFNVCSTLLYLFIVIFAGPRYMKNRKAFDLRKAIVVYNLTMVVVSAWMVYEFLAAGWATGYSLTCQKVDYSTSPKGLRMLRVCYVYWLSKHVEFLDTYFFIARKKTQQITFLHVFHHTIMAYTWWYGVKFAAGGLGTFHAPLNSFVHVIMYFYYGMAALGPTYRKYIWWKKYVTAIQLIQFVIIFTHIMNILLFQNCEYPPILKYIVLAYCCSFFVLFTNFWIQNYSKKSTKNLPSDKEQQRVKAE
nr:elongation of very long chain fatty acids protein 7-like [Ciona intestinalis]|eukprot:XP_002122915.1 elongation of very long chain fatty acids protein 7-like [Ciona intestinalis]